MSSLGCGLPAIPASGVHTAQAEFTHDLLTPSPNSLLRRCPLVVFIDREPDELPMDHAFALADLVAVDRPMPEVRHCPQSEELVAHFGN